MKRKKTNYKWLNTAIVLLYGYILFLLCRFQISTLATKLGVRNIALLGTGLLLSNYIVAIFVAFYMPQVSIITSFLSLGKSQQLVLLVWHPFLKPGIAVYIQCHILLLFPFSELFPNTINLY